MIPRVFYFDVVFNRRETVERAGLDFFMHRADSQHIAQITRYKLVFHGIVAQEEGSGSNHLIKPGEKILILPDNTSYCRWHEGPLEERDNPVERKYCTRRAETFAGFCNQHRNTPRAYYSMCFESMSIENLIRYCWSLDEKMRDKIVYAVYILAYSINGFKVGSTRFWRVVDRIAEQPHVLATILYKFSSAVKTREVESTLGRLNGLTEVPKRDLHTSLNTPLYSVIWRIIELKAKIEKTVEFKSEDSELFRIDPGVDVNMYLKAKDVKLEKLHNKPLELVDYYSGYLLLSDINTNAYYVVKGSSMLHKDTLKVI